MDRSFYANAGSIFRTRPLSSYLKCLPIILVYSFAKQSCFKLRIYKVTLFERPNQFFALLFRRIISFFNKWGNSWERSSLEVYDVAFGKKFQQISTNSFHVFPSELNKLKSTIIYQYWLWKKNFNHFYFTFISWIHFNPSYVERINFKWYKRHSWNDALTMH